MTKELQDDTGAHHSMYSHDHDSSFSHKLRSGPSLSLDNNDNTSHQHHEQCKRCVSVAGATTIKGAAGERTTASSRAAGLISDERNNNNSESCTARMEEDLIRRVDTRAILRAHDQHVVTTSSAVVGASSTMTTASSSKHFDDGNQDSAILHTTSPQQIEPNNDELPPPRRNTHNLLANKIALKRQAAIQELITTEETYVHDLEVLVNHFFAAIEQADCIQLTNKLDLVRNGHAILDFQRNFSAALKQASEVENSDDTTMPDQRLMALCDCFCDWADGFDVYIPYCIHQDKAADVQKKLVATNPEFAAIMDRLYAFARSRDERRTFEDYMIMPVQRLLKYRLILETISKTVRDDDEEHPLLAKALHGMHLVALRLNTEKSGMEARKKTDLFIDRIDSTWAQSPLKPLYRNLKPCVLIGTLDVRVMNGSKDDKVRRLGCALFDTFLIMTKVRRHDKYDPRYWFPLHLFELEDVPNPLPSTVGRPYHAWILRSKHRTFECMAICDQEKQLWVQATRNAIQASQDLYNAQSASSTESNNTVNVAFLHNLPLSSNTAASTGTSTICPLRSGSSTSVCSTSSVFFSRRDPVQAEPPTTSQTSPPPSTPPSTPGASPVVASDPSIVPALSMPTASTPSLGMRSHGSLSDLRELVSDFRAQRRYNHHYSDVDARFADVCTMPILMARAQHMYRDRHQVTRHRNSRIAKSMSMVALSNFHHHHSIPSPQPQLARPPAPDHRSSMNRAARPPPPPRKTSLPESTDVLDSPEETARTSTPPPPVGRSNSSSSNRRFTKDITRSFSKMVEKFSNTTTVGSSDKTPLKDRRWASSDTQLDSSITTAAANDDGDDDDASSVRTHFSSKSAFRRLSKKQLFEMTSGETESTTEQSSSSSSLSSESSSRHKPRKIFRV